MVLWLLSCVSPVESPAPDPASSTPSDPCDAVGAVRLVDVQHRRARLRLESADGSPLSGLQHCVEGAERVDVGEGHMVVVVDADPDHVDTVVDVVRSSSDRVAVLRRGTQSSWITDFTADDGLAVDRVRQGLTTPSQPTSTDALTRAATAVAGQRGTSWVVWVGTPPPRPTTVPVFTPSTWAAQRQAGFLEVPLDCDRDKVVVQAGPASVTVPVRCVEPEASPKRVAMVPDDAAAWQIAHTDKLRDDLDVTVRFDDGLPVRARAHIHGGGSIKCERKSYTVDLSDGGRVPGTDTDEFILISMCLDAGYVHQLTANQLAVELGLFPNRYHPVVVVIGGAMAGVYILLEKTMDTAERRMASAFGAVRRNIDYAPSKPRYKGREPERARQAWRDLLPVLRHETGQDLIRGLSDRMDLRAYLRWVALNSVLLNGDSIDEIWLVGTETTTASGEPAPFFRVSAWDLDDIFRKCHYFGEYAIEDLHGLTFCAESKLDLVLIDDPTTYRLYMDALDEVLTTIPPARMKEAAATTGRWLRPLLADPEVAKAMTEPRPKGTDVVGFMEDRLRNLDRQYAVRHRVLSKRLEHAKRDRRMKRGIEKKPPTWEETAP